MHLSLSLPPPASGEETTGIARAAEAAGLRSLWLYDAHRVWPDPYPHLAIVAQATRHLHFGICVTNPVTRSAALTALLTATLHRISGGRAELGLGRGDASVRTLGAQPASLSALGEAVSTFRQEVARAADGWREDTPIPVWVGTYGPRGLRLAGAVADGVILQFAHLDLVRWARDVVWEAAREAGRSPQEVRLMCAAPLSIESSAEKACCETRWFARMIAGDVATIVAGQEGALEGLTAWAHAYLDADADARPAMADRMATSLALTGTAADCRARLASLAALGVEEMNVFTLGDGHATLTSMARLC